MSTPHFPGWYPDSDKPGRERLWDGQAWTHHLRRAASSSARLSPNATALAIVSCALGFILIVALVASGSDRDPTETALPAPASAPSVQPTSTSPSPAPKLARVPAVKGLSLTKAKRTLRSAGLEVGDIDRRPSSKRKNTVLKQGVDKGTKLQPGSSVDLVVASAIAAGVLGNWQAGVIGNQEAQKCRLQSQEDHANEDHRSRWGGTQSVTFRRNTGQARISRSHRDLECATQPRHRRQWQLHSGLLSLPSARVRL
jgi:PASTA domain/Protein of unknown function (DUF2510)